MTRRSHYTVRPRETLTARQQEVLALMAKGHTNGQIAEALGITLDGAKFHVSEILERLGAASREEAVAAWEQREGPWERVKRIGAGFGMTKLALGAAGAVGLVVAGTGLGMLLGDDGQPADAPAPNRGDVLAAIQRPGTAFYMQFETTLPGQGSYRGRVWYSSDFDASRGEIDVEGVRSDTIVTVPGRQVSLSPESNSLTDRAPSPAPGSPLDPSLQVVPHVTMLFMSDETTYRGMETVDGRRLHRFDVVRVLDTPDEAGEQAFGTVQRSTVYLRELDLLPALVLFESESPDGTIVASTMRVELAYLIALDSVHLNTFDADLLAEQHMTSVEALGIVANLPFETFWLGPYVMGDFVFETGRTISQHRLGSIIGPGVKGSRMPGAEIVALAYGPDEFTPLVEVRQAPAGELDLWGVDVGLAQEAGNVEDLPGGDGFLFVIYQPGNCTTVEAQTIPSCRSRASGQWGALLTREGTDVLVIAHPFVTASTMEDANPFSSREAMLELVGQLERLN